MNQEVKIEAYRVEEDLKSIHAVCFARCVLDFSSGDLAPDEAKCLDACTAKYFQTRGIVNTILARANSSASDTKRRR